MKKRLKIDATKEEKSSTKDVSVVKDEEKVSAKKVSGVEADLVKINETLGKLTSKDEVKKAEKVELTKSVNALAGAIRKAVTFMADMDERISELEKAPKALKSRATFVRKGVEKDENDNEGDVPEAVKSINKRLDELKELREKLGSNEFAKKGFSLEAGKLYAELEKFSK